MSAEGVGDGVRSAGGAQNGAKKIEYSMRGSRLTLRGDQQRGESKLYVYIYPYRSRRASQPGCLPELHLSKNCREQASDGII